MSTPNQDANAGAPSTPEAVTTPVQTPEPANVSQEVQTDTGDANAVKTEPNDNVPFHEHPRWKEVMEERNALKAKLQEIEARVNPPAPRVDPVQAYKEKLIKQGVDESVAELIAEGAAEVGRAFVAPLEQKTVQQEIASWKADLASKHKDFGKYEAKMFEVYRGLPDHMKDLVVSDPRGFEMLYTYAKGQDFEAIAAKEYQRGVDEAYKNKASKSAMSTTPGASSTNSGKLTREGLAAMPNTKEAMRAIWERRHELLD